MLVEFSFHSTICSLFKDLFSKNILLRENQSHDLNFSKWLEVIPVYCLHQYALPNNVVELKQIGENALQHMCRITFTKYYYIYKEGKEVVLLFQE